MDDFRNSLDREQLFSIRAGKPDQEIFSRIKKRWDGISKPIDGLGDFEGIICKIGAIQKKEVPTLENRCAVILCADNGIVAEGVTQTGKEVTLQVARMLGQGTSTASTLAKKASAKVKAVDIGIDSDEEIPGVAALKVSRGTGDFLKENAMTPEQALMAIGTGIDIVRSLKEDGTDIIVTGEMGIGNTTTTTALLSLLTGDEGDAYVGRGAGLSDEGLNRKCEVVEQAVRMYGDGRPALDDKEKAFKYLCNVGGLDIAGLCGVFLGCAVYEIPVVIDGAITAVAALLAECFAPGSRKYMFAAHKGRETGLEKALSILDLEPFVNGSMALGEGTGGLMFLPLLDMALDFYKSASTFVSGGIEEYKRFT